MDTSKLEANFHNIYSNIESLDSTAVSGKIIRSMHETKQEAKVAGLRFLSYHFVIMIVI